MRKTVVAIVDAAHARLFTYQHADGEPPRMHEVRDLVNPGRQAHGMFAAPPARRWMGGGYGNVDDHREDHVAELEARFAKAVVADLDRITREQAFGRVIIVASPRMLGTLRAVYGPLERPDLEIIEIAQDLAWLTSPQLHDHLAAMKLVEPRPRAANARDRRPR